MTPLDASFQSSGKAVNIVEPGDLVEIVFTAPPPIASGVTIELIEASAAGDVATADRLICTFKGQISGGKFKLDQASLDPLNPDLNFKNPVVANFARSTFPPTFRVKLKDDGPENTIPLPDQEDENGSYELKLKITGAVGASQVAFAGAALLSLRIWQDVMIVPDTASATAAQKASGEFQIFDENAKFAAQWRKFAGARRQVLTVPIDGALADFESASTAAAAKAKNGDVILFVGHGGAAGDRRTITGFDSTPSSKHGMNFHPNAINSDVLNLPNIAAKNAQGKWIAKNTVLTSAQQEVDALAPKFDALTRIGNALKANTVKRYILLSCNLGKDPVFGHDLAKVMQTPIGAYDKFVDTAAASTGTQIQIWATDNIPGSGPDPSRPPDTDPNHSSFHEIPNGIKSF